MLKFKKMLSLVIALATTASLMAGCGGGKVAKQEDAAPITYAENIYPMQCEDELTLWTASLSSEDLNESPFGLAWQEQTGVKVHFDQPTGTGLEPLNTLLASGQLPDIMVTDLYAAPGGIQKMAEDGVIIALDDYIDAYAPNLKKYLEENPEVAKQIKSDDGHFYYFPFVRQDERLTASQGLALRKDMLDKAGLDVPVTIDDWTEVLRAFKAQGADAPFSASTFNWTEFPNGFLMGAYGTKGTFYVEDGEVKYGYLEEDKMKGALGLFRDWYAEGLLDKNIVDVADLDGQIFQGKTAASVLWAGSGMGKYMNAKPSAEFELVAAPPAVLEEGQVNNFAGGGFLPGSANCGYITTACKNIELAVRFLDYNFSEDGHVLINFGIEGESFDWVDGYPTYKEGVIINNKDGKSVTEAMKPYLVACGSMPGVQDYRYLEQYYQLDCQKEAPEIWAKGNAVATKLPQLMFTTEESDTVASIKVNVDSCSDEWAFKFITGQASLDTDYDEFVSDLKTYGIDEMLEIYQAAYERFLAR